MAQRPSTKLRQKLLSIGGDKVIIEAGTTDNSELKFFLEHGELFTELLDELHMQPNRCHSNSCIAWMQQLHVSLATGYALSHGEWVRHSWLACGDGVIETCGARKKYFGVVLPAGHAIKFCREIDERIIDDPEAFLEEYHAEWDMRIAQGELIQEACDDCKAEAV